MSCEQIPLTMCTPKKQLVPDLSLGTGRTLKSGTGRNISCREIHVKEEFLSFSANAHGRLLCVPFL
jgi:hypothetical protein